MAAVAQKAVQDKLADISATQSEDEAPKYTRRETLLTMAGVLLVMLLASLDQTIVSTAMPRVIGDLQGFDRYTWVTTAYMLTSTVMVPIYGKLSDIFGRKPIFLIGVVLFLIGSAASGAAQSMNQLIAFRAFQGLGAAALMPIALAVIGDLFTPRERGKWQGLTGAVFGLSSILGPTAGGWITENASWRWVFYVNLPVGIIALFVLIFLMPTLRSQRDKVSIDYLGAALLIAATIPMLLGFTWVGTNIDWISVESFALFGGSALAFIAFFFYEAHLAQIGKDPIIEPALFKSSLFTIPVVITMITSMGMFGSIFFLPLYAQGVLGITATNSGLLLAPLMLSLIVCSVISGQLISRFGKYKWIAILGMFVTVAGSALLLRLDVHSQSSDMIIAMIVLGGGLGFGMSLYTLIVQNSVSNTKIGQATSTLTFFRSIGGTIAVAALGSVMLSAYKPAFHNALPASVAQFFAKASQLPGVGPKATALLQSFDNPNILLSPDLQKSVAKFFAGIGPQGPTLYNELFDSVKIALTQGIHNVFVLSFAIMCTGLIVVFFLKEVPLRGKGADTAQKILESGEESATPMMMH